MSTGLDLGDGQKFRLSASHPFAKNAKLWGSFFSNGTSLDYSRLKCASDGALNESRVVGEMPTCRHVCVGFSGAAVECFGKASLQNLARVRVRMRVVWYEGVGTIRGFRQYEIVHLAAPYYVTIVTTVQKVIGLPLHDTSLYPVHFAPMLAFTRGAESQVPLHPLCGRRLSPYYRIAGRRSRSSFLFVRRYHFGI